MIREVELGDIARIERKGIAPEDIKAGTFFVGLENLNAEGQFQNVDSVEANQIASTKFHFSSNHVLYGKLRPYLKKISRPDFSGICSTDILPILPGKDLDKNYLYYFLRQPNMIDFAVSRCSGANLPRLSPKELEKFKILLPPLEEQRRIAAILDKADAIRRKRQQAIALTETFLRSVFLDMFGDPVTNPKGWETATFSDHIGLQGGYAFKSTDYAQNGIPLVRIGNANKGEFDQNNLVYMDSSFRESHHKFIIEPGDMLITLTGTVGKDDYGNITVLPSSYDEWFLNQRVAKITFQSLGLLPAYVKDVISHKAFKFQIIKNSRGVRQANLNNSDILDQVVPVPPLELQELYADISKSVTVRLTKLVEAESHDLALFSSLSQKAFRGELTSSTDLKEALSA